MVIGAGRKSIGGVLTVPDGPTPRRPVPVILLGVILLVGLVGVIPAPPPPRTLNCNGFGGGRGLVPNDGDGVIFGGGLNNVDLPLAHASQVAPVRPAHGCFFMTVAAVLAAPYVAPVPT